ncbi:MAG: transketolase C-terminal domain-containing protein [Oscillospiraceae bacterium]|nr:transketolase C-terminal domain-containing protein [Oscillospiraceae bacterium]
MKLGEMLDPRKTFGAAVTEIALKNKDIVVLSADSGKSSGFGDFMKAAPERYYELGIMEQGATGIAAGLATAGKIPVFCAIAPFVSARNYEMFRNDIGYMRQNVKIVGRNSGISYSDLGSTHHSLDDFAIIGMIPGVSIIAPQDPGEIRSAAAAMLEHEGPVYMRIGNNKIPCLFEEEPFIIGKGRLINEGEDITLISTGSLTGAAMGALELLRAKGIAAELLGLPTVCPLDRELILASVRKTGRVVTIEEHYIHGGLGAAVCELLCEEHPVPVLRLGVPHDYATSGPYDEVLSYYGLDAAGIAASVEGFVKRP